MYELKYYLKSNPSDIHIGGAMTLAMAQLWCKLLNEAYPDLVHYFEPL